MGPSLEEIMMIAYRYNGAVKAQRQNYDVYNSALDINSINITKKKCDSDILSLAEVNPSSSPPHLI